MQLSIKPVIKSLLGVCLVLMAALSANVYADKKFANLTGFAGEQNGNLPDFNEDPIDEQGWDVFEDPFGPLVARETPYYQNDSRDIGPGEVFIKAWEYDPPNALIVRVFDQRDLLLTGSQIDVRVEAGYYDDNKNLMVETRRIVRDIPIKPGENYITLYFPVERTHIVHARVINVRNQGPIKLID
ncbi:hypothetical protein [Pontibacterium sp.]|uniref:hypothetical protein n=1 Tax=Pontibacterium sp. TaxID=2036026 RepID=UPI003514B332